MATIYNVQKFLGGVNGFGLLFCDSNFSVTLSADSATALAVPATGGIGLSSSTVNNQYVAIFTYTANEDVFVCNNDTAAVPAGDSFASSTSMQNPKGLIVKTGDTLSFVTAASSVSVTVSFYSYTG